MATDAEPRTIHLMLVDDHPTLLMGLALILEAEPDMTVVAQASNGDDAISLYDRHRPDVVLMDLRMSGRNGLGALAAIRARHQTARIIILTSYDRDEDVYQAMRSGAMGYLVKDEPAEEILGAIRLVSGGRKHFPLRISEKLAERLQTPDLSDREREVLRLMALGQSNKEIAASLSVSLSAVKYHVNNILAKLGADDRTQAVLAALKKGLTDLA